MPNLKSIASKLDLTSYLDARDILVDLYKIANAEMGRISWLAISSELGFGRNNLVHLFAQGRRALSLKTAHKISEHLDWKGINRRYWLALVEWQIERDPIKRETLFRRLYKMRENVKTGVLDASQYEYFDHWYYPAIRELVAMPGFKSDPEWIARTLIPKIRLDEAKKGLDLLEKLGMISYDKNLMKHVITEQRVTTGDNVDSIAIIRYHQHMMEHAKDSITGISETIRDINAVTLKLDDIQFDKVRSELAIFRDRLLSMSENSAGGTRVWQLNMQLFPLSENIASEVVIPSKGPSKGRRRA